MTRYVVVLLLAISGTSLWCAPARRLLVISVDGLDHRYLAQRDQLGLKIPNIRRLLDEGAWADGVCGEVPTVTWPAHTTMITGVSPSEHGILGNRRPAAEGGEYYWNTSLMKVDNLWRAAHDAGLKTGAITWPVSVGAPLDWNLPEYFQRRRGGAMDLDTIGSKSTPGLVDRIARMFPSFAQQWMDDRTRTQAVVYLLRAEKPDFLTLHLVDLDAEEHETGPFSKASLAILEYTDELIGQMLAALPPNTVVALVSDHGFARADKVIDLRASIVKAGVQGKLEQTSGFVSARDEAAASFLDKAAVNPANGIGRRIPREELQRFAPKLLDAIAVYEAADGYLFGAGTAGAVISKPHEFGVHGLWPGRASYRSVFALWGPDVKRERLPELRQTDLARRFAEVLGISFTPGAAPAR